VTILQSFGQIEERLDYYRRYNIEMEGHSINVFRAFKLSSLFKEGKYPGNLDFNYYKETIIKLADEILEGKNPEVKRAFGPNETKAIQIIRKTLGDYKNLRRFMDEKTTQLILAFYRERGLEQIMKKGDIVIDNRDYWQDVLPIKTIQSLIKDPACEVYFNDKLWGRHMYFRTDFKTNKYLPLIRLALLYQVSEDKEKKNDDSTTFTILEGLKILSGSNAESIR